MRSCGHQEITLVGVVWFWWLNIITGDPTNRIIYSFFSQHQNILKVPWKNRAVCQQNKVKQKHPAITAARLMKNRMVGIFMNYVPFVCPVIHNSVNTARGYTIRTHNYCVFFSFHFQLILSIFIGIRKEGFHIT